MQPLQTFNYKAFKIGACFRLTDAQLMHLSSLFTQQTLPGRAALGGRSQAAFSYLEGVGHVVVKYYTRGGQIGRLVKHEYLRLRKTRARREFEFFNIARHFGISAPEPIAYATCGYLFYKGWLVTRAVENHRTLAAASMESEATALRLIPKVVAQISRLVRHRLLHLDLHPGNVLVDSSDRVYLIDFDKARFYFNRKKLREKYLRRWHRAVVKHGLPICLYEAMADSIGT